jgi:hypothetical protein
MRSGIPMKGQTRLDPEARRRKYMWSIVRSVLALGVMIALGVWLARLPRPPRVLEVVMATALYDDYRPVVATSLYHPKDTFFASVHLSDFAPDTDLLARWSYQGNTITETALDTKDAGQGYAGFSLDSGNQPWAVGDYRVEIVYRDEVLGSAAFRVEP